MAHGPGRLERPDIADIADTAADGHRADTDTPDASAWPDPRQEAARRMLIEAWTVLAAHNGLRLARHEHTRGGA